MAKKTCRKIATNPLEANILNEQRLIINLAECNNLNVTKVIQNIHLKKRL